MKQAKLLLVFAMCFVAGYCFAQNITVKGTISDASTGEAIPYASVVVKGGNTWATSKADGTYSIEAPSNGTLSFSLLGYAETEVAVNGRAVIDVALASEYD